MPAGASGPSRSNSDSERVIPVHMLVAHSLPRRIQVDKNRTTIYLPSITSSEFLREILVRHTHEKVTKKDNCMKINSHVVVGNAAFKTLLEANSGVTLDGYPKTQDGDVLADITIVNEIMAVLEPNTASSGRNLADTQISQSASQRESFLSPTSSSERAFNSNAWSPENRLKLTAGKRPLEG